MGGGGEFIKGSLHLPQGPRERYSSRAVTTEVIWNGTTGEAEQMPPTSP